MQTSPSPAKTPSTLFGVVNINKPAGMTSHTVVSRVRKIFNLKKVGHSGTLDPAATGVLPTFIGNATRLIEYMPDDKHYDANITFGAATNTWDADGEVQTEADASHLTEAIVRALLPDYQGVIQQTVPPFSAVHVNGKKLYHYARAGVEVELPVREATIHAIELLQQSGFGTPRPQVTISIHCASGTYVRAIAHELGEKLGVGAHLSNLVRTQHGQFHVKDSIDLESLMACDNPQQYLQSPLDAIRFEHIQLSDQAAQKITTGQKLQPTDYDYPVRRNHNYCLLYRSQLLAIADAEEKGRLSPSKVFMPVG